MQVSWNRSSPAVLIMLRIYLQIYVEHSERLERLARSMSIARAPMLVPLQKQTGAPGREYGGLVSLKIVLV